MYAKHLGKMYAKLLYGAKNAVPKVLTNMQQQNTKSVFVETHFFTIEFCQNQGKNVISSV